MPDVLAKVRRRLIPFMFLLYIVAYLDRVNIGFAALLINSIGNLGGFLGPYAIGLIRTATQGFEAGLLVLVAALVAGGSLALVAPGQVIE